MSTTTREQDLLRKMYESQEEIQEYINEIKIDSDGKCDINYKTVLTLLTVKKDLVELVSKLERIICDKQELM